MNSHCPLYESTHLRCITTSLLVLSGEYGGAMTVGVGWLGVLDDMRQMIRVQCYAKVFAEIVGD